MTLAFFAAIGIATLIELALNIVPDFTIVFSGLVSLVVYIILNYIKFE
jgi:hypothetical protein